MSYPRVRKNRALKLFDNNDSDNISDSEVDISASSSDQSKNISTDHAMQVENESGFPDVASHLQEKCDVEAVQREPEQIETSSIDVHLSEASSSNSEDDSDELDTSSSLSDAVQVELPGPFDEQRNLRDKLRDCAIKHVNHITRGLINDLLGILRSEGHTDLPKNAETLLRTQRTNDRIRPMLSKRGTYGTYMYLGIKDQLQSQVSNSELQDEIIKVLVNIDGLPIYSRSKQQLWPILMQVWHKDYYCKPFVVALYCGDSKPFNADIFLTDFVEECTTMVENGFIVENSFRHFEIAAFVCDTPARSFIKCCKGHSAFYACERCVIHGKTVNKKRVYPQINCKLRTENTFVNKNQPQHHLPDITSPLIRIPRFDPVKGVVLDYMHLLCCGVMKSMLEKWLSSKKQKGKIGRRERNTLRIILDSLSSQIPVEFQRKVFDITDLSNWKATQYRFILLYSSGLILRSILSTKMYRHFLRLFVACRILCSHRWALMYTDQAELFLRDFFKEMPNLYGKDSQVMNFHNLIHLADDVRNLQAPLTDFSSFPFENCLGNIKKLIRTPRNPVAQIFRRLSEKESSMERIKKYSPGIINRKQATQINQPEGELRVVYYDRVKIRSMEIGIAAPNNIVKLNNGDILKVTKMYSFADNLDRVLIRGKFIENLGNAFEEPMASSKIGIYKVSPVLGHRKTCTINCIRDKCILLNVEKRTYIVTLLHLP